MMCLRSLWVDGGLSTQSPLAAVPNVPPIVEMEYGYDRASNRTHAYDARPGGQQNLSWQYLYDGLDRLEEAKKGNWNESTSTFTQDIGSQEWSLDLLGNWDQIKTDRDGSGTYTSTEIEAQNHNLVNELTGRDTDNNGFVDRDLTYDDAGNLRDEDRTSSLTYTYTHDAWNRLVKVDDGTNTIHESEYNGLN